LAIFLRQKPIPVDANSIGAGRNVSKGKDAIITCGYRARPLLPTLPLTALIILLGRLRLLSGLGRLAALSLLALLTLLTLLPLLLPAALSLVVRLTRLTAALTATLRHQRHRRLSKRICGSRARNSPGYDRPLLRGLGRAQLLGGRRGLLRRVCIAGRRGLLLRRKNDATEGKTPKEEQADLFHTHDYDLTD
jgi:hypothetical protein